MLKKIQFIGIIVVIVVGGIYYVYQSSTGTANADEISFIGNSNFEQIATVDDVEEGIYIDISGAVSNPGVYVLPLRSIVNDVVVISGGFTEDCDKKFVEQNINLAQRIVDGQKIYIPYQGEVIIFTDISSSVGTSKSTLTNINTASLTELETLPSVGPVTAQAIIDGRPYKKKEDIMNVKGIGEATYNKLKDKISV